MYAHHAAPWSGHFPDDVRDRTTHHKRTKQRGKEDWTWEDILNGKGSWTWEDILNGKGSWTWEEILAGKDHLPWEQVEASRKAEAASKGAHRYEGTEASSDDPQQEASSDDPRQEASSDDPRQEVVGSIPGTTRT